MLDTIDPLILHRIQFAMNISFHILFPTITIGLAWILLFMKIKFDQTKNPAWDKAFQTWIKIFALTFALGVVSGITMSFQFGTNWPNFMKTVGNIAGPLLAYEVLSAFFLEATFLGIMLFGRKRVSNKVYNISVFFVAFGTTLSAFWILALNSWMHTPAGFEMRFNSAENMWQAHVLNWWAVIFNPSFPYRFLHMYLASFITAAFVLLGVSAYQFLKIKKQQNIDSNNQAAEAVKKSFSVGLGLALVLLPLQIIMGDLHGLNTLKHQPAKLAAMEGIWQTEKGVPAVLFGIPNETTQRNDFEIAIPKLASFYLTHDWNGEVKGLKDFDKHPPVKPVFFAFRVMVGCGLLMLFSALLTALMWRRMKKKSPNHIKNNITTNLPLNMPIIWLKALTGLTFMGWVATLAGWYVTEIGRQPYLVYGILLTKDAAAKNIIQNDIFLSLGMYITIYIALMLAYISTVFYLAKKNLGLNLPFNSDLNKDAS
jgi:cytochrome bd ubiquinol oxidase subunit I